MEQEEMQQHGFNFSPIKEHRLIDDQIMSIFRRLMVSNNQELKDVFLHPVDYEKYVYFGIGVGISVDPADDFYINKRGIRIIKDENAQIGNIMYYQENTKTGNGRSLGVFGECISFSQEDLTQRYIDEAYRVAQTVGVSVTTEGIRELLNAGIDPTKVIVELANSRARNEVLSKEIERLDGKLATIAKGAYQFHQHRRKKVGMDNWKDRVKHLTNSKR